MKSNLLAKLATHGALLSPSVSISEGDQKRLTDSCVCSQTDLFTLLDTGFQGLSDKEAEQRLSKYGPNELSKSRNLSFWRDMFERFKSPLVLQLLIIALVSAIIGEFTSSLIVGFMILLSVGLSYILDERSNREVEVLGKRVQSTTYVLRDGVEREIRMSEVVPGDIVLLHAGAIVPADIRLLTAKDFFVSESALTGESLPVEKTNQIPTEKKQSALDLTNACFMGTSVTSGSARAVVINTGKSTLFGEMALKLKRKTGRN